MTYHLPYHVTIWKNAPSCLSNLATILDLGHQFWPEDSFDFINEIYDQNYIGNDISLALLRKSLKNAPSCLSNLAAILDWGHKFWPGGCFDFKYEICDQNYMENDTSHDRICTSENTDISEALLWAPFWILGILRGAPGSDSDNILGYCLREPTNDVYTSFDYILHC